MLVSNATSQQSLQELVLSYRRYFHQYPELSREEKRTSEIIKKFLKDEGIPFKAGYAKFGVMGIIRGEKPGGTVALRADIDALPIHEENDHEYVSTVPGKMHACGHDAHTAMLMGAARLLNEWKEKLEGTVLLIFQPAEEMGPIGGAKVMLDDGLFDEYKPDAIFAQHVWPDLPVGQVGVRSGPIMGNSDQFTITVKGEGGHASMPHQGKDAIVIAAQVITHLQTIVSRNIDPLESAVLTFGEIEGGDRYNIIPSSVTIKGTVRTNQDGVKEDVKNRFLQTINGLAMANDVLITLDYVDGYPATVNSHEWEDTVRSAAYEILGDRSTPEVKPSLGGEDFSRFLQEVPGFYYWIGTAMSNCEEQKPLHDSKFDIDERMLGPGAELFATVAVRALEALRRIQINEED